MTKDWNIVYELIKSAFMNNKFKNGYALTPFFEPYIKMRRGSRKRGILNPMLSEASGRAGVYIIKNADSGKIQYVGNSTSDLKRTLLRHFQVWNDTDFTRPTYLAGNWMVRLIYLEDTSNENVFTVEAALIDDLKPVDNRSGLYSVYNNKWVNTDSIEDCKDCYNKADQIDDGDEIPF